MANYGCAGGCKCARSAASSSSESEREAVNATNLSLLESRAAETTPTSAATKEKSVDTIILDMMSVQFVDEAGCKCLRDVVKEYSKENVDILFAHCNGKTLL